MYTGWLVRKSVFYTGHPVEGFTWTPWDRIEGRGGGLLGLSEYWTLSAAVNMVQVQWDQLENIKYHLNVFSLKVMIGCVSRCWLLYKVDLSCDQLISNPAQANINLILFPTQTRPIQTNTPEKDLKVLFFCFPFLCFTGLVFEKLFLNNELGEWSNDEGELASSGILIPYIVNIVEKVI